MRGARHDGVRAAIGTLPRARAGARKKAGGMRLGRASGQRGRKQKPPKTQIVKSVATGRHGFFMPRNENNHSFRELRYVKESKTFAVFGNKIRSIFFITQKGLLVCVEGEFAEHRHYQWRY